MLAFINTVPLLDLYLNIAKLSKLLFAIPNGITLIIVEEIGRMVDHPVLPEDDSA